MSWGQSRFTAANAVERSDSLRDQHQAEQNRAREAAAMPKREKSPTGIQRGQYDIDGARSAVGSLNRKVDEAIDEVAAAFERQRHVEAAAGMTRQADAKRAPALDNPRGVR
jgi:hypothetical protein